MTYLSHFGPLVCSLCGTLAQLFWNTVKWTEHSETARWRWLTDLVIFWYDRSWSSLLSWRLLIIMFVAMAIVAMSILLLIMLLLPCHYLYLGFPPIILLTYVPVVKNCHPYLLATRYEMTLNVETLWMCVDIDDQWCLGCYGDDGLWFMVVDEWWKMIGYGRIDMGLERDLAFKTTMMVISFIKLATYCKLDVHTFRNV